MVTSLFKHSSIKTTEAKAKGLRIIADNMVTLAKRGDLHARRQALAVIQEKDVVHTLFDEMSEKFASRQGGYTRITKLGPPERGCGSHGSDRTDPGLRKIAAGLAAKAYVKIFTPLEV
jgi:ribosomal protein L17